jgi:hypothetical protein
MFLILDIKMNSSLLYTKKLQINKFQCKTNMKIMVQQSGEFNQLCEFDSILGNIFQII